jgi:hypothetical protein
MTNEVPKEQTMANENDLSQSARKVPTVEVTVQYLNALCKAVGLHIDPKTADVEWIHRDMAGDYRIS